MGFYLIAVRWSRWRTCAKPPDWVPTDDVPGTIFADFRVDDKGHLSVWWIDDQRSNCDDVVTALAATRDRPDDLTYVLVDESVFANLGLPIARSKGRTPSLKANDYHRDVLDVYGSRLLRIASAFYHRGTLQRVLEVRVEELLRSAVVDKRVDLHKINRILRQMIEGAGQARVGWRERLRGWLHWP